MIWPIIALLAIVVAYNTYRYYHNDDNTNEAVDEEPMPTNRAEEKSMEEKPKTKELVLATLKGIGCDPQEAEEGCIVFDYQGITFLIDTADECLFVNLIWPWCHSFSKYDIDEFSRVRQVVNNINMNVSVTVFYTISDSDEVAIHIKKHFLFVPQVPHLDDYLRMMLDTFFRTARALDIEVEKARVQECGREQSPS